MKTKAYAFVSMIVFAVISPVVAAQAVTSGLGPPLKTNSAQPRYQPTTIQYERVGLKTGTKKIVFYVHSKTAGSGSGFVVNFPQINEPNYATVTATALNGSGAALLGVACNATNPSVLGKCTFPSETRTATIIFAPTNNAFSYRTYSAMYYQACDNSATRYCGTERLYAEHSATFTGGTTGTEEQDGALYQGDVDIFNGSSPNASNNTPRAGDVVSLSVLSDKAITGNIPSLRVKAVFGSAETQVGHRYGCESTDGGLGYAWDCKIPEGDAVPNLSGYTNPRIVFSSSRSGAGATITIKNATKNTNVLVCN